MGRLRGGGEGGAGGNWSKAQSCEMGGASAHVNQVSEEAARGLLTAPGRWAPS